MATKKFAQMSTKKLSSLLEIAEPEDAKTIRSIIEARQRMVTRLRNKFTIVKHIGKNDKFVVREFDDEDDAKEFINLLRKSEQSDFIYSITQTLDYSITQTLDY